MTAARARAESQTSHRHRGVSTSRNLTYPTEKRLRKKNIQIATPAEKKGFFSPAFVFETHISFPLRNAGSE